MNHLVSKEEIETLYAKLSIAHMWGILISNDDMDKYSTFITNAIIMTTGEVLSEKVESAIFTKELLWSELTEGMNGCLQNKELVAEYGELWLAKDETLVELLQLIADGMATAIIGQYQAMYN